MCISTTETVPTNVPIEKTDQHGDRHHRPAWPTHSENDIMPQFRGQSSIQTHSGICGSQFPATFGNSSRAVFYFLFSRWTSALLSSQYYSYTNIFLNIQYNEQLFMPHILNKKISRCACIL